MSEQSLLPDGFEYLEPFALAWGEIHTQSERYLKRQKSSMKELEAFHKAAAPRLGEIFDYLDQFPVGELPEKEARLYRTVAALAEVMQAVEVFGQPTVPVAPSNPHHVKTEWVEAPNINRNA
jgi:hypothetical protein